MPYNMTSFGGSTNILSLFSSVDSASGNLVFPLMLITIGVVLFVILLRRSPPQESLVAASTVTTIIALFLLAAGAVSILWVVGFTVLWAVGGIALYIAKQGG